MKPLHLLQALVFLIAGIGPALAQGNIHSPGEGGVFTQDRLALLKNGEGGGLGNNPSMMNLYNDMRIKFGKLGEEVTLGVDDIEGSIFYNESFLPATLYMDGEAFKKEMVRYDAYNDELQFKENGELLALLKHPKLSCIMGSKHFLFKEYFNAAGEKKEGYLTPVTKTGTYRLFEQNRKIFKEGKPAKTSLGTSFPHRFVDDVSYYAGIDGNTPVLLKLRKSDLLEVFEEEHRKAVKDYIKKNSVDLKDHNGLKGVFLFANNL